MTLNPATTRFITSLEADVNETLVWWAANHPGRPFDPDVATGLCGRRFPISRHGKWLTGVDEALWASGRARYLGVRR